MPLYMMISFTRIPYAQAVRIALRQRRLLRALGSAAGLLLLTLLLVLIGW